MEIKDTVWCLFEQSGTFKKEFLKLGYNAVDVDIQNNFNETDYVIDLFGEEPKILASLEKDPSTDYDGGVIELYKNNSLVTKKEDYIKISPKEILESTEKSTSTLIQAESIEKFQNGTEDIYIDEEYDEMEF